MSLSSVRCWPGAACWPGGIAEPPVDLAWGVAITLDGRRVMDGLAQQIPWYAADLLEVAACVHAADRLTPRIGWRSSDYGCSWSRTMRVRIPVRRPDVWNANAEQLAQLLRWLSDDEWILEFCQGEGPLTPGQSPLFETAPPDADPVLFSGGMDSTAGLARDLFVNERRVVAVSVFTNNWMLYQQRQVIKNLTHGHCLPVQFNLNLRLSDIESSQRTRGFVYLASGIAAAWTMSRRFLRVYENGIGAINLPYLRSQYGAQATRAMHPKTLHMMSALIGSVTGEAFSIDAPYLTLTKAELIASVPEDADQALQQSVSCDSGFSARVRGRKPCGICTSCLLRRLAIHASKKSHLEAGQLYRRADPSTSEQWAAMAWQALRLERCLRGEDPWNTLMMEFPALRSASRMISRNDLVRLYRTYCQEWAVVSAKFGDTPPPRDRTAA